MSDDISGRGGKDGSGEPTGRRRFELERGSTLTSLTPPPRNEKALLLSARGGETFDASEEGRELLLVVESSERKLKLETLPTLIGLLLMRLLLLLLLLLKLLLLLILIDAYRSFD